MRKQGGVLSVPAVFSGSLLTTSSLAIRFYSAILYS